MLNYQIENKPRNMCNSFMYILNYKITNSNIFAKIFINIYVYIYIYIYIYIYV